LSKNSLHSELRELLLVLTIFVSAQIWHELPSTVVMVQLLIGRLCLLLQLMCVNVPFLFVSRLQKHMYMLFPQLHIINGTIYLYILLYRMLR
jgi:hypothetical protein